MEILVELILGGHINRELYDREEINDKCKGVTAMKFFKGQENDRIYCKEQQTKEGIYNCNGSDLRTQKDATRQQKRNTYH